MKRFVILIILATLPVVAVADCADCRKELDWQQLERLWKDFAADPGQANAQELIDAFRATDNIVIPPEFSSLGDTISATTPVVLSSIDAEEPWATQLGLRIVKIRTFPQRAELSLALARLATSSPRFFLDQLSTLSRESPCLVDVYSIVQYFGTLQELRDRADPKVEDVKARIDALASVRDPTLAQARDSCIGLLELQRDGLLNSKYPRALKRVFPDLAQMKVPPTDPSLVVAEVTIGVDGRAKTARILRHGDPNVEARLLDALRQWVFEPMIVEGQAKEFSYVLTVRPHNQ